MCHIKFALLAVPCVSSSGRIGRQEPQTAACERCRWRAHPRTKLRCSVTGLRQEHFRRGRLQSGLHGRRGERDDGDDADDCNVKPESRRKGDKRFFVPKTSAMAKPFRQFSSSRKEFRKDYERAFKCIGWEVPKTNVSHATWEAIKHMDDANRCGYPRVKANVLGASVYVRNQLTKIHGCTHQNNVVEVQAQAVALKHLHDAVRTFDETMDSMKIVRPSVTKEKTAFLSNLRRQRIKIKDELCAAKGSGWPLASTSFRPRFPPQPHRSGSSQKKTHRLTRRWRTRRQKRFQLAASSLASSRTTRTRSNAKRQTSSQN